MMDRLALNCDAGDTTIDVIGFSRGAALAISFANEVARKLPTLSIRFIGVWDIVGEFGLPGRFVNAGHDLRLPPNAKRVYHAMALDEARSVFQLTRLCGTGRDEDERLVEVWFRGVHSDIGGGNGNFGLNWHLAGLDVRRRDPRGAADRSAGGDREQGPRIPGDGHPGAQTRHRSEAPYPGGRSAAHERRARRAASATISATTRPCRCGAPPTRASILPAV